MLTLKENDWITINEILLEIYAMDNEKQIIEKFLKMLSTIILFDKAFFLMCNDDNGIDVENSVFINIDEDIKNIYIEKFYDVDYIKYVFSSTKSVAFRDTDIIEGEKRNETKIYKEFFYPNGMKFGLGVVLIKDDRCLGMINLFRDDVLMDFSEKELQILNILKEHLSNILGRFLGNKTCKKAGFGDISKLYEFNISKREFEIIELMLDGLSNDEISQKLMISVSTVKKHIYNIFSKLGINSRLQLLKIVNGYGNGLK